MSDRHRCPPARRARPALWRFTLGVIGSGLAAFASLAVWPDLVPGVGMAVGGSLGYVIGIVTRN